MRVIKRINNNVVICVDKRGKELVAFGKGIGFPPVPYEINDLRIIERTFYNISSQYIALLNDIPTEIIEFTAHAIYVIRDKLPYELNPNVIMTLADHIAFAIERMKKDIYIQMSLTYDLKLSYPQEVELAKDIVKGIREKFNIQLPSNEVSGIAMNIINAKIQSKEEFEQKGSQNKNAELLERITGLIEHEFDIEVNRSSFSYARFATHVQYLMSRLFENKHIDTENIKVYHSLSEEYPDVNRCVDKINDLIISWVGISLSQEEKLYLILHVNRIRTKEGN